MMGSRFRRRAMVAAGFSYMTSLALLLVIALFAFLNFRFFTLSNAINVLRQTAPLAIASMGQLVVILVGGIDISTGAVVALTGVTAAIAAKTYGVAAGFGFALAIGAMAGLTSGVAVHRLRVQPVIATIGMASLARGLAFFITDGLPVLGTPAGFTHLGSGYLSGLPIPVYVAGATFLALWAWLSWFGSGRALFAIGGSEEAARLAGIRVEIYKPAAYAVAGALSALAGLIYTSRAGSGQPTLGYGLELQTIAAVVLGGTPLGGGRANVPGVIVGSLVVGLLANGMDLAGVSPYVQEVVLGVAIIAVMLVDRIRRASVGGLERRFIRTSVQRGSETPVAEAGELHAHPEL